jgi:hypothetical protein
MLFFEVLLDQSGVVLIAVDYDWNISFPLHISTQTQEQQIKDSAAL